MTAIKRIGPKSVDVNSQGAYFVVPPTVNIVGTTIKISESRVNYQGVESTIPAQDIAFTYAAEGFFRKDKIVANYTTLTYNRLIGDEAGENTAAIAPITPFNRLQVEVVDITDGTAAAEPDPGETETPESIRNKLQMLNGENRLDAAYIKNLPAGGAGLPHYSGSTPYQYGVEPTLLKAVVDGYYSIVTLKNTPNTQALETRTAPSMASNSQWYVTKIGTAGVSSYNDLSDKPALFSGAYDDLSGKPVLFSGAYADLSGKPNLIKVFNVRDYGAKGDNATDDTAAIQAAINACATAGGGNVYFPAGQYVVAGALQTNVGGENPNCQLYMPKQAFTDQTIVIRFLGDTPPSMADTAIATLGIPLVQNGTIIRSTITGTGTHPAVFGCRGPASSWGPFSNVFAFFENLIVRTKHGSGMSAIYTRYCNDDGFLNVRADVDVRSYDSLTPPSETIAFYATASNAGTNHSLNNTFASGYTLGYVVGEHATGNNIQAMMCYYGLGISWANHAISLGRVLIQWCRHGVSAYGSFATGKEPRLTIQQLDFEKKVQGKWYDTVNMVQDTANKLYGSAVYHNVTADVGRDQTAFVKNGGTNFVCRAIDEAVASTAATLQISYSLDELNTTSDWQEIKSKVSSVTADVIDYASSAAVITNFSFDYKLNGVPGNGTRVTTVAALQTALLTSTERIMLVRVIVTAVMVPVKLLLTVKE